MVSNKELQYCKSDPRFSSFAYVRNNPLVRTDPYGLFEWGDNLRDSKDLSPEERERRRKERDFFKSSLKAAREGLNDIKIRYGKDSQEYSDAKRSLEIYKNEGDKGVIVDSGPTTHGGGETAAAKDKNGNVTVVFDPGVFSTSEYALSSLVGHEGLHLDDVASGRRTTMSDYESEFSANHNQSVLGEAYALARLGGLGGGMTFTPLTGLGGGVLYDPSWENRTHDESTDGREVRVCSCERDRRAAVDAVLLSGYKLSPPSGQK